ncbi:MAG: nucleotide-binding universal stress UspA family protein [Flavobacteriales bacterium]|jgi:nucleotide-binding universal stress UspA family protein
MAFIIVPTDFSESAYNALFYATQLFPNEDCNITLVHSFESQFSTSTSRIDIARNEKLYDTLEINVNKQFEKIKHKIIRDNERVNRNIETVSSAQPLCKIVNHLIVNTTADFVVMGTKGASGLQEVFIGSKAVSLIKKIKPIPIFLIPQNSVFQKPTSIAYATDLKVDYAQYPLEIIKEIIRSHKSKLHISHIYNQVSPENTVEYNFRKLKLKLEDVDYSTHWISSKKAMRDALAEFCEEHNINLLVLMYHKYGFLKGLLKTSFVEKVSFKSQIPLLILPDSF